MNHPVRSVFVQWPLLLREGERMLADLSRLTEINTIELSNFFLDWGEVDSRESTRPAAALALPSTVDFGRLPVPLLDDSAFEPVRAMLELIHGLRFSAVCNVAPLYIADPELIALACVDVTGNPVPAIRSSLAVYGCPNNPDVLAYGEAMMRGFVTCWPTADAIALNHVEMPFWPQTWVSELFVCFCDACRDKAEHSGLDFERIRHDVALVHDLLTRQRFMKSGASTRLGAVELVTFLVERPALVTWLHFRLLSLSDYIRQVVRAGRDAAESHNPELRIGLEFHAPAVSALVGTDFHALAPLFDWLSPKIPDYLAAEVVPLVAEQIAAATGRWTTDALCAALRELFLLGGGPTDYELAADPLEGIRYRNAFALEMVDLQLALLGDLGTAPVYPYLWRYAGNDAEFAAKLAAIRRRGFDGFFSWVWDRDLSTEALTVAARMT